MIISDFAIKRPLITVVAMVAMVIFGTFALFKLKTDEFPDVDPPFLTVGIVYPGASPDVVESEVLKPVEEQIGSISGVKRIMGKAYDGYSMIMIEFFFDKDLNVASQEVRDAISSIRSDLPTEMKEPIVNKFNDTDRPIVSLAISSTVLSPAELTRLADPGITRELRALPGVADVQIFGKVERELTVEVDPHKLQAANISVAEVVQALQLQNLAAPVGRVNGDLDERAIRLRGRLDNPAEFENLIVADRNGQLVRLGQVATIKDATEEPRTLAIYNSKEAIGIDVKKAKGYSTTDVANRVRARLEDIQPTLPNGTKFDLVKDSGVRVDHAVRNVIEALILGAALTVLVVFLFLNSWRSTVITGVALPISVLASFIAVWALGFKLETMSLLGLSLAIGILIDDAIVVRENIVRHVEMGKDHYTAAREGTDEIGLAVAATTFSIVAVFVPVGFMPGIAGQWFKPFALTIAAAVLVSLFVSFSLDPMLSAYWADPQLEAHERRNPIARALERFNAWFDRQAERYKSLIAWALDHRWTMIALAAASFVGAIALQVVAGGFSFVPVSDNSELNIAIQTPPGSSLDYTTLKAEEIARLIRAHKEVSYTYTTVGSTTGASAFDNGSIYVRLVAKKDRSLSQDALGQVIRKEMRTVGGATAFTFASGFGGAQKQLQLQLQGPDQSVLNAYAERIQQIVASTPGAVDVGLSTKGQKPEIDVKVNRGLAGTLGVSLGQLATSLRFAFAGVDAGTWVDPAGISRYVHVRLVPSSRENAADLGQLPVMVVSGGGNGGAPAFVPLSQVAEIRPSSGPSQIDHFQRERVVNIGANVEGASLGEVSRSVLANVGKLQLPAGYHISTAGETQSQNEVFGNIFIALGVAVMLMYLILVVQFGSFLDPLAILISLPLSLIGVVLALLVTRDTLNLMSLIGVILLMGIVAKNAILLIDFAKWAHTGKGLERREALIEAGRIRLRPILMTTLALIAGMIPVALGLGEGADFRAPLGRAVIGGVITSTVLTLIVIPTVYEILDEWREWLLARFKRAPIPTPVPEPGD